MLRYRVRFGLFRCLLAMAPALVPMWAVVSMQPGCGPTLNVEDGGTDAGPDAEEPTVTVLHPEAQPLPGYDECVVTITTNIAVKGVHVDVCTPVVYPTNPPAGGDHWGVWAAYTTYETPVPREMYVHNMEHGGVLLLHNCGSNCDGVLALLQDAKQPVTGDEKCLTIPEGPTERVITTPDPLLDVPIAAAAWGATYTATCLDLPSLSDFVKNQYDNGPESTCAQGKLVGDPDGGAPNCDPMDAGADGAGGGAGGTGGAATSSSSTGGTGG